VKWNIKRKKKTVQREERKGGREREKIINKRE
jgi:hypothetical protein